MKQKNNLLFHYEKKRFSIGLNLLALTYRNIIFKQEVKN